MIGITGKRAVGAVCGLLFALGAPPVAQAAPEVPSGPYSFTAQHGPSQRTATWTFTPCGATCTTVNAERWLQNAEFHLNGSRWEYSGRGSMDCPVDHTPLPVSKTVSFDAVTLAGQWTTATLEPCGRGPAGGVVGQWDFQLTKAG
ncbi:hypothetical protein [Mycolicibacter heraklionensis]|uniref:hypothetical protein n=1 Tax=Mycolicibacter heraklionensis TaxID=512402 RepID=UPI000AB815D5|nr:hypothetical protein [Mycolicibacter heraklionensis]